MKAQYKNNDIKTLYTHPFPIRATYRAHLILLDFITLTIVGEEIKLEAGSEYIVLTFPQ
jgi:hypothetical protein